MAPGRVNIFACFAFLAIGTASPFTPNVDTSAPTPTPTTPFILTTLEITPLPYPWNSATMTLLSDASAACTASMTAMRQNSCGRRQSYSATTTVDLEVPCLGCTQLALHSRVGGCPLGGPASNSKYWTANSTVIQATHTFFRFVCAPTPATTAPASGTPAPKYEDVRKNLTVPTVPARLGMALSYTPTAMWASKFAEGFCYNVVEVAPTDGAVASRECAETSKGLRPAVYTTTTIVAIDVACEECDQEVRWEGDSHYCSQTVMDASPTITAAGPKTTWAYRCAPKMSG